MKSEIKNWLVAVLLTIPLLAFFTDYYFNNESWLIPTGFIQYDNVSYIAYAKQYLDADQPSLFYSNPFNESGDYPKIYFQLQNFLLLPFLQWVENPGFILMVFTFICSIICFRIVMAIYDHLQPEGKFRSLSIMFFCWGGGLYALSGVPAHFFLGSDNTSLISNLFMLEPGKGWWGLNLGRALLFSCEAYYHVLFLLTVLFLLKRQWPFALLSSLAVSLSHPFTGAELLCIVTSWAFLEQIILRNKLVPFYFVAGMSLLLLFHLTYYLFYLNQFPDHQSVSEQYSLNWRLGFLRAIPAYCIVGLLSWLGARLAGLKPFLQNVNNRFFICWFLVAFALANHDLFMKPMQPIHFTRGYIWTSLFLLGLPGLLFLLSKLNKFKYKWALTLFTLLFLSDNIIWILSHTRYTYNYTDVTRFSAEQKELVTLIGKETNNKSLIISHDHVIPYISTVYTEAYPWISHPHTTPFFKRKQEALNTFINSNEWPSAWKGREVIFIFRKEEEKEMIRAKNLLFPHRVIGNSKHYIVLKAFIPH